MHLSFSVMLVNKPSPMKCGMSIQNIAWPKTFSVRLSGAQISMENIFSQARMNLEITSSIIALKLKSDALIAIQV